MSTHTQKKFTHYKVWLLSTKSEKGLYEKGLQACIELGFNNDEPGFSGGAINEHDGSCIKGNCRKHWENFGIEDWNWEFFLNISDILCLQFDLVCFVPVASDPITGLLFTPVLVLKFSPSILLYSIISGFYFFLPTVL